MARCFQCCAESSDATTEEPILNVQPAVTQVPPRDVMSVTNADNEHGVSVPSEGKSKEQIEEEGQPESQSKGERPRQFQVKLAKAELNDQIGAVLDVSDNSTFVIDSLQEPGLVSKWNAENPTKAVSPGDRIMSVNGVKGSIHAMLDNVKAEMQLSLEVVHPQALEVTVKRDATGLLGIELSLLPNKSTVVIRVLKEGPLNEWTKANSQAIRSGDRIVSANGVSGNAESIAKALVQSNSSGEIVMTVWHYG